MGIMNINYFEESIIEIENGKIDNLSKVINEINLFFKNYIYLSTEELKILREYVIRLEPYIKEKYPIVPYNLVSDKIMIIADTHLGNENLDTMGEIEKAYDVAEKENINTVLLAGDIIDGFIPRDEETTFTLDECRKKYDLYRTRLLNFPHKKGIKTLSLIGNHDLSIIYNQHFKIYDLIYLFNLIRNGELLGIGKVYFNWKSLNQRQNCRFILNHEISTLKFQGHAYEEEHITLSGHHHYPDFTTFEKEIYLPPLSNAKNSSHTTLNPSFSIATFDNDTIRFTCDELIQHNIGTIAHKKILRL